MRRSSLPLALTLLALVVIGCNDGRPKFVPVSGRVLVDGKPVAKFDGDISAYYHRAE